MDNERYKAWLHRRVEKSDQSLAKHGLTKKSDPQEKPLLNADAAGNLLSIYI